MNNFRMWMANLMRGRYGTDELNKFLLVVALVLIILDMFVRWRFIDLLTVLILIYVYCRMFSRNINNRYRENQKFLGFISKFRGGKGSGGYAGGYSNAGGSGTGGFSSGFSSGRDKTHKILRCPGCGEKLRVPKGAGTIMINCPHCNTKFKKKV